ncbi:hypothetical protein [Microcoleus sp. herbarium2]|uniref:hypothetical protein n=1 Tax=Microcoleus sp. herbarium2 TaxID=3055433 RepID=UPI002FD06D78
MKNFVELLFVVRSPETYLTSSAIALEELFDDYFVRDSGHEIDFSVALFSLQLIMKSSLHSPLAAASREIHLDLPGARVTVSLPKQRVPYRPQKLTHLSASNQTF